MNAPKELWIDPDYIDDEILCVSRTKILARDVPYIREDLVLGLVEALNECLKVEGYKNARDMIEVALKKLEEE